MGGRRGQPQHVSKRFNKRATFSEGQAPDPAANSMDSIDLSLLPPLKYMSSAQKQLLRKQLEAKMMGKGVAGTGHRVKRLENTDEESEDTDSWSWSAAQGISSTAGVLPALSTPRATTGRAA